MIISLIVAASTNNAIGKNNQLLWHLPKDLKFFKNTTWGMPVIMGRKTFESVNKPLPGRINIVITRQVNWQAAGVLTANNIQDAFAKAAATNCKEAFIIGGGQIYAEVLPIANNIYLTSVDAIIEGDTFFPSINKNEWNLVSSETNTVDEKHAYNFTFQLWQKNNASSN
jgi:dihydrofolate reductase